MILEKFDEYSVPDEVGQAVAAVIRRDARRAEAGRRLELEGERIPNHWRSA